MPKTNESAIVFGAGTNGIATAIALKYLGCKNVMLRDYSVYRLKIARSLGFEVCNNKIDDLMVCALDYLEEAHAIHKSYLMLIFILMQQAFQISLIFTKRWEK